MTEPHLTDTRTKDTIYVVLYVDCPHFSSSLSIPLNVLDYFTTTIQATKYPVNQFIYRCFNRFERRPRRRLYSTVLLWGHSIVYYNLTNRPTERPPYSINSHRAADIHSPARDIYVKRAALTDRPPDQHTHHQRNETTRMLNNVTHSQPGRQAQLIISQFCRVVVARSTTE